MNKITFEQLTQEAAKKVEAKEKAVATEAAKNTVAAGHVYIFKRQRCYIDWLVLFIKDDMAFIVPRDHSYLEVGMLDVLSEVSVVRCNLGHWVDTSFLLENATLCDLEEDFQKPKKIIKSLFLCECPEVSKEEEYVTDSPEYQARCRRIERCFSRCAGEDLWE